MSIRGFMMINGQELMGKIVETTGTHYMLDDVVGVGIHYDAAGHATVGFRPVSILAETVGGTLVVSRLPVPLATVLFDYPVKDNMMQNYMAMKSNLVVASSMPVGTAGRIIN